MKLSKLLPVAAAVAACSLAPSLAEAQATTRNCFILVNGYKSDVDLFTNTAEVLKYWGINTSSDFGKAVTGGTNGVDHYAVVGWNSRDNPYWHANAAGTVATQIANIKTGATDGKAHDRQCTSVDRFYIVAHSQGAQVMTYINGNAQPGDPNLNAVSSLDQKVLWKNMTDASAAALQKKLPSSAPSATRFDTVMSDVIAVITLGGAVNGTEGMDLVCNNTISSALAAAVGKTCVPCLQTAERFNPSSWTGENMFKPTYAIGGHGTTLLSGTLTGEDDGVVNLASQMNCKGSPKRNLWKDLREGSFACTGSTGKRHGNHYNLASINIAHNAEVTAPGGYWGHTMSAAGVLQCGDWWDVPGTIAQCINLIK